MITLPQFLAIMPRLLPPKAEQYLPPLNAAMEEAEITTPLRQAAFLAQLAHESDQLHYMEEIASGAAYEGRHDLGNLQPGDGKRYKGRGPIQLTGRANYRKCGAALGVDLENHPELAALPEYGFRIAAWYWTTHKLNAYADTGDFLHITKAINGNPPNGVESRQAYYVKALDALGTDGPVCSPS